MPPPDGELPGGPQPRERHGRREATFLLPHEWPEAGAFLEQAFVNSGLSKRSVLAQIEYEGGTNRLNSWFRGTSLPKPETLEKLCRAFRTSYLEAIDRYGYYHELLRIFDDLVQLGEQWLKEDDAYGVLLRRSPDPKSIRDSGVVYWRGRVITWGRDDVGFDAFDPLDDPAFEARYAVGAWYLPPPHFAPGTPEIVRNYATQSDERTIVVPRPMAIAILLAVLAFPRRGDIYKEASPQYRYDLAKAADALVKEARRQRVDLRAAGRPRNVHRFLQRASDTLDDSSLEFNSRRPIAAEYMMAWADSICEPYARYARLAAFELWGEAGGRPVGAPSNVVIKAVPGATTKTPISFDVPSVFAQMPQLTPAELPEIETLTT